MSGTSFFTLGLGDVAPTSTMARLVTVVEAGMGFGFLALVIGYLPMLYQAFSRREVAISLLDARAGSPPTAFELLRRHADGPEALSRLLGDWEHWAAELLDACALVIAGGGGPAGPQAQLTFAIARHAVADLAQVFRTPPLEPEPPRLVSGDLRIMRDGLAAHGFVLADEPLVETTLAELRQMYEPYVAALASYLFMALPPWRLPEGGTDNWRTSAWGRQMTRSRRLPFSDVHDEY